MNSADVRIQDPTGLSAVPTAKWYTKANNTALNPGELVVMDSATGQNYIKIIVDAQGTVGDNIVGLVKSKDNVTSTAYGTVDVYVPVPGVIYAAKAKSSTAANTDAKIIALTGKRVIIDVTAGVITVDSAASDAVTNAIVIVGGNSGRNELYFMIKVGATFLGNLTN